MKIREGFVTNSSSSSALITYKDEWTRERVLDIIQHPWKYAAQAIRKMDELYPKFEKDNPKNIPEWCEVDRKKMDEELKKASPFDRASILHKYGWPPKRNPEFTNLPDVQVSSVDNFYFEEVCSWIAKESKDEKKVFVNTTMDNFDLLQYLELLGMPRSLIEEDDGYYFDVDEVDGVPLKEEMLVIDSDFEFDYYDVFINDTKHYKLSFSH